MFDIKQLHICGLDEMRPPRIRKEPYIDLYFKLSEKAPAQWCEIFNDATKSGEFSVKIDPKVGLFIDTWVRKPEEIPLALQRIQQGVAMSIDLYLQQIRDAQQAERDRAVTPEDIGEQGKLNQILAQLDFAIPSSE